MQSTCNFRAILRVSVALSLALEIIFSLGCSTAHHREEANLRLQLGTSMLEAGNLPGALRELLKAEAEDPNNEVIQNNIGLVYFLRDRNDIAIQHLRRALEIKPLYSDARNNYGRLLIETAQYDRGISEIEHVLTDLTYDQPQKAYLNLGLGYFRKGDYLLAKTQLTEALKIDRRNCLAQILYGRAVLELGELEVATHTLDNSVILCKDSKADEARYYSGLSYYKLGQPSPAIARMEEVVRLYPEGAYAKKAQSLLKLMK